ncbi:carbohydrate binding domain-containing protein [Dactylosporangium sp. NPDC005572]|uniref:carbohydrate binding domain-containing protein n=1 Tax=Dactylosporangium sp. NPDC005572 TaxID=3156889 RepID=UPI00339EDEC2
MADEPYLVQFVDRIGTDPTVRLDVCGDIWSLQADSDLTPPAVDRAYGGSLLTDGRPVTAAAYGNRVLRLELLLLDGVTEDDAAAHVQNLTREISRPANILRWQPGTSQPVFFRTLFPEFGRVIWEPSQKRCSLIIPAEPFAYGVKVDLCAPMNSNPYFEANVAGWTPTGGTFVRSTAQSHQGVAAGLLTPSGVASLVFALADPVPVTPGVQYRAAAWVRCSVSRNVDLAAAWTDAGGANVSAGGSLNSADGVTVAVTGLTWTLLETIVVPPPGAVQASLRVRMTGTPPAGNLLYVDEATLSPAFEVFNDSTQPSPPLNSNPYFEIDASGWNGTSATLARSTAQFRTGSASLLLTTTGTPAQAYARAEAPVVAGRWYTVSMWCYSVAGYGSVSASVDWLDASHTYMSTDNGGSSALGAATWARRVFTVQAPVGAAFAQFGPTLGSNPPAATQVYVDDAQIGEIGGSYANGCYFDIDGASIIGDVETPLFLSVQGADLAVTGRRTSVMGVRRRGAPVQAPLSWQVEGSTLNSDSSLQANDAAMSGFGQNFVRTSFSTTTAFATRAQWGIWPPVPSVDSRGTYRAFLRCRKTSGGDTINVLLTVNLGSVNVVGAPAAVPNILPRWVDLGLFQLPAGADPVTDGYSGVPLPATGMQWRLTAERAAGVGNLDMDAFVLVPADDRQAAMKWPEFMPSANASMILDGASGQIYALGINGDAQSVQPVELAGGLPMVSPGQTTRIVWLLDVATVVGGDDKTLATTIKAYYWPRFLYVRGAV